MSERSGGLSDVQWLLSRAEVLFAAAALVIGTAGLTDLIFGYTGEDCEYDVCRQTRLIEYGGVGAAAWLLIFFLPAFICIAWGAYAHAVKRDPTGFPLFAGATAWCSVWGVLAAATFGAWVLPGAFLAFLALMIALAANLPRARSDAE